MAYDLYHKGNIEVVYKKAIPETGREGPYVCETSKLPHFLDNRLKHGGEVTSLTCLLSFSPRRFL
jgi:hypothetical protein